MTSRLYAHNPRLLRNARQLRSRMTDAEQCLWQHLRDRRLNGYKFRRQQPIGNYIADFVCMRPKLIVEADGSQHDEQRAYDETRSENLRALGFHILRFWNHDILQQTEAVLTVILNTLEVLDE